MNLYSYSLGNLFVAALDLNCLRITVNIILKVKCIFSKENFCISIEISLELVPKGPIIYKQVLVQTDNGLVPNKWKDQVPRCHLTSLGHNELRMVVWFGNNLSAKYFELSKFLYLGYLNCLNKLVISPFSVSPVWNVLRLCLWENPTKISKCLNIFFCLYHIHFDV